MGKRWCVSVTGRALRPFRRPGMRVIHRVDIHATVWEAALTHPGDWHCWTSTQVVDIRQTADDVDGL